jgi:hypothetical protein
MPYGKNAPVSPHHLLLDQSIEFILGPLLSEESLREYNDAKPGSPKSLINGAPDAISNLKSELIVPYLNVLLPEEVCEFSYECVLILRGMTDESVIQRLFFAFPLHLWPRFFLFWEFRGE